MCDAPNPRDAMLGLGPLDQHRSSAVSGENRYDLLIGGQFFDLVVEHLGHPSAQGQRALVQSAVANVDSAHCDF